ncbi:ligand-gated channel [Pseudorhodoferax aquiterrae]|uniref:Ligand-gated channel n=1 Tax=Pseudorhodoferax aquiterrae TaxID=747304 RepID=A0ABQ3GCS2_9BURK|nr:TonB-dependent siderophore receptor [Pseudorhodoferax aquiterrae]GHD00574.1 ligand-gated channel [Pseudorhodoferax aquiterrae]
MPVPSSSLRALAGCALTPLALCLSQLVWAQAAPAGGEKSLSTVNVIGSVDQLQSLDFYAPNSSAVVSREDIDAMGSRKLDQALQYQAGVVGEPFGADNKVEWFRIRGFEASVSVDGAPTTPNGFFVAKPEIFGLESVEVVKGANSMVFGAASSGGVVNLVSKRPKKVEALAINTELGNRGKLGLGVDFNGVANADGSVYYRLVAQARKEDGMQRGTDMDSYYFAPSLTAEFSKRTTLTLLASLQRESGTPTNGFMPGYGSLIDTPYGRIDRRTNLGEPDFDHLKRSQVTAGWLLRHELSDDWAFTQNYKYTRLNLDQQNVFAWSSDNDRQALRGYSFTQGNTRNHYLDNRVSGTVRWGDLKFTPVVGLDYLKSDTEGRNNGFGPVPNIDMFNPVYGAPISLSATPYEQPLRQFGAYASTQLQVGSNWNFNAGIRHDRAKSSMEGGYDVSHNSINAGAMYITSLGIAPYLSYSESFKPVLGLNAESNPYKPYEGRQAEVGLKLEPSWLNGGTMTLAYFELEEKNALAADASNVQRQIGKRTNHGIEWQGDFKLARDTAIKASYTHNDSKQDVSVTQSVRTPLIPRNQASLWISQRFSLPVADSALTVAVGARYNGSTVDETYYAGRKIAAFTLLDLMARYDIDRQWALQLNVRNLTDKTYVSACDFYCYYGGARTVDLQLQYRR